MGDPEHQRSRSGSTGIDILASLLLAAATLVHASAVPLSFMDDAYISFRYAWNLSHGHGLVFNAGEAVEGYSNLAWVLLASGVLDLGIPLESGMRGIALVCLAATPVLLYLLLRLLGLPLGLAAMSGLLLVSMSAWVVPLLNGLEGPLFSLLLLSMTALNWRISTRPSWTCALASGLLGTLLAATRPEGAIIYLAQLVVLVLILIFIERAWRRSLRTCAASAAAFVVGFCGLTAWRLNTYGDVLPNAVLAKLGPEPWARFLSMSLGGGLRYSIEFIAATFPLWLVIVGALLWIALRRSGEYRSASSTLLLLASVPPLIGFAIVLANNGDWMPHHRLLAPYLPLLALMAGAFFDPAPRAGTSALLAASLGFAAIGSYGRPAPSHLVAHQPSAFYRTWCQLGADLQAAAPVANETTVASEVLGVLSYCALDLRFKDLSGLTDRSIAREEPSGGVFGRKTRPGTIELMKIDALVTNDLSNWKRLVDESEWFRRHLSVLSCDALLAENVYVFLAQDSPLASAGGILSCPEERMTPEAAFIKAGCLRRHWEYPFPRPEHCPIVGPASMVRDVDGEAE